MTHPAAPAPGAEPEVDVAPPLRWDHLTVTLGVGYVLLSLTLGVNTVLASLREELGLSGTVTSLHGSFFGWGLLVAGTVGGRVVRAWGRPRTFVTAALLGGGGALLFATGAHVGVTLAGALGVGIGGALMMVVVPGVVADHHGAGRAAALTVLNALPAGVGILAPAAIGAAIGAGLGWNLAYGLPAVAASVAVVVRARRSVWPADPPTGAAPPSPWPLLRRRRFRAVWLLVIAGVVVEFGVVVWGVTFLREVAGASAGLAPVLGVGFAIGVLAGRSLTPALLRRSSEVLLVRCGFLLAAAGGVLLLVPVAPVRVGAFVLLGLGVAPVYPLGVDRLFAAAAAHEVAAVSVAAALASGVAITFGPLAIGVLADLAGLATAVVILPVVALAGALAARRVLEAPSPVGVPVGTAG